MRFVLFGNAALNNAAIRYRVVKFSEMLEADGHTCQVCLLSSFPLWERLWERGNKFTKALYVALTTLNRIGQLRHVFAADAVFFRGPLMAYGYGPPALERIVHFINPRMVFDIDDAVWEPPDGVDSPFLAIVDLDWIWKMCRMCRRGIVGNTYLKENVEKHNPNVTIIPTCIDMDIHTQKTYGSSDGPVVLGWTGVHNNLVYMDVIADVLKELAQKHDLVLSVASNRPYDLDGVKVVNYRWHKSDEIKYLQDADIGLMPLEHSRCALGKCAFKALQHMGVGTPCVITPVGMNAEVVEDGVNGFLADSPEEWYAKLESLILDAALRERMGRAARQTVIEKYSHQANYPKFKRVMELVATGETGTA
ncbi:MAG: glycosyltransferase family 4 protein [Candidatus Hydrogenedentes bacterium]|nr:glycosyltransferase family 4 protein [Candidatus Hydrogenedentota bacterium]